eukprot:1125792-Ditylum_brightwellii.AAC.1
MQRQYLVSAACQNMAAMIDLTAAIRNVCAHLRAISSTRLRGQTADTNNSQTIKPNHSALTTSTSLAKSKPPNQ